MTSKKSELTHLDDTGSARMVDVGEKSPTRRVAVATAIVTTRPEVIDLIDKAEIQKGDVLAVSRLAGITGAKKTADLIPLCHPLALDHLSVDIKTYRDAGRIEITVTAKTTGKTGVEMEALTGASLAALAVYDMCKAVDKAMVIGPIQLQSKEGGKSGSYRRKI